MSLSLLLSVPHAGTEVPAEVAAYCALTPEQIVADGDEGAAEIYALAADVAAHVTAHVARAVVDLNRAPDDRSRDGAIKTHTCWEELVWDPELPAELAAALIDTYWRPYHRRLSRLSATGRSLFGVDGHTMAAHGPRRAPTPEHNGPRPASATPTAPARKRGSKPCRTRWPAGWTTRSRSTAPSVAATSPAPTPPRCPGCRSSSPAPRSPPRRPSAKPSSAHSPNSAA
ncbi:MAG: N-formylglutamate amidohydrolase [bacterium]|nr:N-formylglutamate amidohydrolase [bacterium]